ncbi:phosphate ABC transporter substrate-binding/OmpA family protein [Yoonia sp.]|uniref:phosphate ABC transporter substrate-binding/OmpA family protein n=1 Tax=Yoonia sp. TaxID=2212373 RepID=UPI0025FB63BF|nr:phosphate ABC transporter substrate-binding/OmpA family protein [Yoonia sp.]
MTLKVLSNKRNVVSALALSAAMLTPAATWAGEVTLKSADGTVNLIGEFIDFADNNYVIRTGLGDLRISAARVRCEGESCPDFASTTADVRFAGSDTVGEGVMPLLLSGYAAYLGAEATVTATGADDEILAELVGEEGFGDPVGSYLVTSTGSGDAFRTLLSGTAQVGMASRRITPDEARALRDAGAGNMVSPSQEHIIAVDSLIVITNPENPVTRLTMDQLRGIYGGQITNWSEVDGANRPIKVSDRPESSGTGAVFRDRVFGDNAPATLSSATIIASNNDTAAFVNEDPDAIGFVGYAFQRGAQAVKLVNECGLTMSPDAFSARTEEYALQRFLYLYSREDMAEDAAKAFLDYSTSDDADEVIAKAGFIDLGVDRRPQELDGDRARQLLDPNVDAYEGGIMREMLSQMVYYDRLSTTFRFRTGSQALDPRGLLNLARLADYLEKQPEGTKILFVGFTDDVGAFDSNRDLSIARAQQVMATLTEFSAGRLDGVQMASAGYGEVAPSACNTTENERRINRRVEVWIQSE